LNNGDEGGEAQVTLFAPNKTESVIGTGLHLVLEIGCTVLAHRLRKIVSTKGANDVPLLPSLAGEPSLSALRMKCVPAGTVHLSRIDGNAAFNPTFKQSAHADSAIGII
jgi:hypothetical protein